MSDVDQSLSPPVFQPDEAMLSILKRQKEQPLSIDQFDGSENRVFTIVDGDAEVPMTLVKVKRLKRYEGAPCQNPGTLLFRADRNWLIPQRLYVVRTEGSDDYVLFLTQVAHPSGDAAHIYFETVFN